MNDTFDDSPYRYLSDESKRYICYRLPVNEHTDQFACSLRYQFIEKTQAMGYRGYDTNYDEQFHQRSSYFYVRNEKLEECPIFLSMRVTEADHSLPFPFEKGEYRDGCSYLLHERANMLDLNTFFGLGKKWLSGFSLLISAIGLFANEMGCRRIFGLVDVEKPDVERLYRKYGKFWPSREFEMPVFFRGYTFVSSQKDQPVDVHWRILEWSRSNINEQAARSKRYKVESNQAVKL